MVISYKFFINFCQNRHCYNDEIGFLRISIWLVLSRYSNRISTDSRYPEYGISWFLQSFHENFAEMS